MWTSKAFPAHPVQCFDSVELKTATEKASGKQSKAKAKPSSSRLVLTTATTNATPAAVMVMAIVQDVIGLSDGLVKDVIVQ